MSHTDDRPENGGAAASSSPQARGRRAFALDLDLDALTRENIVPDPYVPYAPGRAPWLDQEIQDCIPGSGVIHEYMHWATQTTHAPQVFHLACFLGQYANCLARLGLHIEFQSKVVPRLFTLLIAPSGAGKSTPMHLAHNFFEEAIRESQCGQPHVSLRIDAARTTPNGLQDALSTGAMMEWGGVNSELAHLFCEESERIFDTKRKHPLDTLLINIADNAATRAITRKNNVDAKKGEDSLAELVNPVVSATFAMPTASFLSKEVDKASEGGLVPRFLVFIRDPKLTKITQNDHPVGRTYAVNGLKDNLQWFLQRRDTLDMMSDGQRRGVVRVTFDPLALAYYMKIRKTLLDERNATHGERDESEDAIWSYKNRAYNQALVVAALYALSNGTPTQDPDDPDDCFVVDVSDMARACRFVELAIASMVSVQPQMGRNDLEAASRVIRALILAAPAGRRSKANIFGTYMKRRDADISVFHRAFNELIQMGVITPFVPPPSPEKRGKGRPFRDDMFQLASGYDKVLRGQAVSEEPPA